MVKKEATKKTHTCLASAVLLSIIIVSLVCVIGSTPLVSGSPTADELEKEIDPASYAASLGAKLRNSFPKSLIDGQTVTLYPLEYAGAYLDHSYNLHIVLSKYAANSTIDTYRNITGNDPTVIFEVAEFPLSYLYEVYHTIDDVMLNFGIQTDGVNEAANRVELNLEDSSKQQDILAFLNTKIDGFDAGCITFLGRTENSDGLIDITPSTVPSGDFVLLGTDIPAIYGAVAIAIVAVTIALACYLAFTRHRRKTEDESEMG